MASKQTLVRNPHFRWLWLGHTVSVFGDQFSNLAIPVLAVTVLNATTQEMGYLAAAGTASFLLVGLIAGAWVDRWVKRRVMLTADAIRFLALLAIPILWATGQLQIWHLFVVAGVVGLAAVFFDVASQSFTPVLLPKDQIGTGNSALETSGSVAGVAGPSLVGFLLGLLKAPVLVLVDSLSFAVSAITLSFIKDSEVAKPKDERRPLRVEIAEGLRFVRSQRIIRTIALTTGTGNFFSNLAMALLPIYLLKILHFTTAEFGLIMSLGALGALAGASLAGKAMEWIGEGRLVVVSAIAYGFTTSCIPAASLLPHSAQLPFLLVTEFFNSVLVLLYNITQVSARQRICPPQLLGRMNASIRFFIWGVMPIGALLSGWVAQVIDVLPTIWIGCAGVLASSVFVLFSPLRSMRKLPEQAE
ncbi:MAG: MFS transporter [Micrococcales bacterium]